MAFARLKGHLDAPTTTFALEIERGVIALGYRMDDVQIRVTTTRTGETVGAANRIGQASSRWLLYEWSPMDEWSLMFHHRIYLPYSRFESACMMATATSRMCWERITIIPPKLFNLSA